MARNRYPLNLEAFPWYTFAFVEGKTKSRRICQGDEGGEANLYLTGYGSWAKRGHMWWDDALGTVESEVLVSDFMMSLSKISLSLTRQQKQQPEG